MDPDDWPADMRDHHLRDSARSAYWDLQDCKRAADQPVCEMIMAVTAAVVSLIFVGWWSLAGLPVLLAFWRRCRRRLKWARIDVDMAKARLDALKAQGAKVRL